MTAGARISSWITGGRGARALVVALPILLAPAARTPAADLEQFLQAERTTATTKLVGNVLGNGAVIASPSTDNPNYYYHWVRDGALAMAAALPLYAQSTDPGERQRYLSLLTAYVDFSLGNQITANPSTGLGRGLGEPKFNTDGSAFTGPWGRPQDDGPALRALTGIRLANILLDSGAPAQAALVRAKLYDSTLPTNSLIKRDLEYVSHNWQATCFDPWEEVSGHHFYARLVQRRALLEGAGLARRLGDKGAADWYALQAAALEPAIQAHWDGSRGYLVATLDRDGGLDYKACGLDTAVLLGVLHAHAPGDDFFSPTSDMVLATAAKLSATFDQLYPINRVRTDPDGGALGSAIGRYPEDRYGGQAGTSQGNAWVLCTLGMAELYLRVANEWARQGRIAVTDRNRPFFQWLNAARFAGLQPGQVLTGSDTALADILSELRAAADRHLRRVRYHAFPDGSLSEQMNRDTGFMQSARDLTWNYASVLTALAQRTPVPAAMPEARTTKPLTLPTARLNRAGIPVGRTQPIPSKTLNKGGIPIQSPAQAAAMQGKPGIPDSAAQLADRVAELEKAVKTLSREVRALREGKERPMPK